METVPQLHLGANLGVALPAVAGCLYCLAEWRLVARIKLESPGLSRTRTALLDYGEYQLSNMLHISGLIADGANSFLMAEYRYLLAFIAVFYGVVAFAIGPHAAIAFVWGCSTSIISGYIGMKVATKANVRTTRVGVANPMEGYRVAIRSGCVASFSLVSLGVLSIYSLVLIFSALGHWRGDAMWVALGGFSFGVTSIGLFSRVGGGIYTKAADIGADLSGKMDRGLLEDDFRNPACIADNVGDNVGGVVANGADLLSSFAGSVSAALVIAGSSDNLVCDPAGKPVHGIADNWTAMMFPLLIPSSSIVVSVLTKMAVDVFYGVKHVADIEHQLKRLVFVSTVAETPVVCCLALWCLPPSFALSCSFQEVTPLGCTVSVWLGLWSGLAISYATEYYTSTRYAPVREIAAAQRVSAASGIIFGLAGGYLSVAVPVFCLAATVVATEALVGPYGIALAALGMLSTMPLCLAIDAYNSIADNAVGIAEMSGLTMEMSEPFNALGGTRGLTGNGFTISSAAFVSLALFHAFSLRVGSLNTDMGDRWYFTGLLLGAALPYIFSAIIIKSVGRAASDMAEECRRQFPYIIDDQYKPDYKRCIKISLEAALRDMVPAGLLAVGAPVAIGLLFGKKCTAGLLQGCLVSGVQMAISMINTGGAWDNAKKFVAQEEAKDSEAHKNATISDLVGDPLKDVSGPSMNILVNLSAITSFVFGKVIGRWSDAQGGPFWAGS